MKRAILFTAMGLAAGAAQAEVVELQLFQNPEYQGASETIKGEVNNLQGPLAKQATSAIVKGGYWEVCTDDHFKGTCRTLQPGQYPRLDNVLNDRITSIRFLGNDARIAKNDTREDRWRDNRWEGRGEWREARGSIELYGRPDFRGRSVRVDRNVPDLNAIDFDGRASSIVVNDGVWQLCTEPGFRGQCGVFRPGRYEQLTVLDDRVSSMRQLR